MADKEKLYSIFMEVVNNQLANNEPPEANVTLSRLLKKGFTETESKKMIATCIAIEIFRAGKYKEEYNNERYLCNLKNLPKEPVEKID